MRGSLNIRGVSPPEKFLKLKTHQIRFRLGLRPDPAGGVDEGEGRKWLSDHQYRLNPLMEAVSIIVLAFFQQKFDKLILVKSLKLLSPDVIF